MSASDLTSFALFTMQSYEAEINNLVFIDDSTLISSTKNGMEHMLTITEESYQFNNTAINHKKYVLLTNTMSCNTSVLLFISFQLKLSALNHVLNIDITPLPVSSSFRFWAFSLISPT